ncbi:HEPN domain-containing protein [Thermincola ferriacetica]|uniref:HEPN domain-containing protein n=1 Tax=Thermincola ferriacetica TaxID=281456 RepID=A0A0L6W297_9FIRM|nr:HEPN domain-containing protein [Thermincola ferriacetica]KNZ69665.1 HEPN domain-containing protein [Thermincola ferriacetica]
MVDSKRYKEWFAMAEKDLKSAKILFEHDADYGIVCFHCQQAIEKYLKGYLILKSGELIEGHSLVKLCKKASQFDETFKSLVKDCAFVNAFYIETRYPAEDSLVVSKEEVEECFRIVNDIVGKVNKEIE